MNLEIPTLCHDIELRHARAWIGRRLVLKSHWLDFEAGTPCRVMSLVDFGDGLLFWIKTDDPAGRDVDQVTRRELEQHFRVDSRPPDTAPGEPGGLTARRSAGGKRTLRAMAGET
ncbi:MAG: hypothetical protein U5R46_07185 [Gammaproteobacteria bacterium]|nr:hypothetical protein [Gammaproteobacteria bacterium]